MASNPHAAWSDFWAHSKNTAGKGGQDGGCLPSGYQGINAVQRESWSQFAKDLPANGRVLDLATGDGRVMAWLMAARRDAKLAGCDMAPELPPPPRGAKVKVGVRMEKLPYRDNNFAAVTSQFGFEYGETAKVAAEAARVLAPGGLLAILTHRQDGPILAHNVKRREQILWAIEEQGLPELAKRSLQLRSSGLAVVPEAITAAPALGAQAHGKQSAAWEIAEAIRQSLVLGARDHPANVAKLIDTIVSRAKNEIGRIASLDLACATTADEEAFGEAIAGSGFELIGKAALKDGQYPNPFADFRTYRLTA